MKNIKFVDLQFLIFLPRKLYFIIFKQLICILGTLIEAAKVGNVSKMLGRSKSEDSVCNSSHTATPVHGQMRVTYAQNSPQHNYGGCHGDSSTTTTASTSTPTPPVVCNPPAAHVGVGSHFFHTTSGGFESKGSYILVTYPIIFFLGLTAIAALKRKRKKFSSSKNICPVTESVAATNAAEILSDKVGFVWYF